MQSFRKFQILSVSHWLKYTSKDHALLDGLRFQSRVNFSQIFLHPVLDFRLTSKSRFLAEFSRLATMFYTSPPFTFLIVCEYCCLRHLRMFLHLRSKKIASLALNNDMPRSFGRGFNILNKNAVHIPRSIEINVKCQMDRAKMILSRHRTCQTRQETTVIFSP